MGLRGRQVVKTWLCNIYMWYNQLCCIKILQVFLMQTLHCREIPKFFIFFSQTILICKVFQSFPVQIRFRNRTSWLHFHSVPQCNLEWIKMREKFDTQYWDARQSSGGQNKRGGSPSIPAMGTSAQKHSSKDVPGAGVAPERALVLDTWVWSALVYPP